MASVVQPLASTLRVVEWDELPATAREIDPDFDPLDEGVLMLHQRQWLAIHAPIKVAEKGRRTGITFAQALDDTITAASQRVAGGDNIFYIGDTKEKGLEFIGYCAAFARVIATAQGQGMSSIEEFLFDDQTEDGKTRQIASYRIRFASGFQIVALSSSPANIRGLQGKVRIDEAAFHKNVQAVLDAATALLIWGGEIVVISTHNGKKNAFNQLIKDIEAGRYGPAARVFRVTFDDAVANGIYERVCLMKRIKPTAEGKREWYAGIRNTYGPRKAAMREELDAIPRDGNGVCIPGVWIEEAMQGERPLLRLTLGDEFIRMGTAARESYVADWIDRYLKPALRLCQPTLRHVFGMDFARHRNFSCIAPMAITAGMQLDVPFGIELHNVPTRQQEQILWAMIPGLPRFSGGGMDATGSGETLAEYTADKFGHNRIHQIKLNLAWYGAWMPKLIQTFEDGVINLPRDANWQDDLRTVEDVDGIPMVSHIERKDLKDPDLMRHGDSAIALVLARYATLNLSAPMEFMASGRRESIELGTDYLNGGRNGGFDFDNPRRR